MTRTNETHAERRTVMLRLRVTVAEKTELLNSAKEAGLTISDWVRGKAIGTKPVMRRAIPNKEIFLRLLAALGKAGSNWNQIARQLNRKQERSDFDMPVRDIAIALEELKGISQLLRKELDGDHKG